jgi:hypothetical protein
VVSTRVLDKTPGGSDLRREPVAYLVGETELLGDITNYWILSDLGLRALLNRTGWDVISSHSAGAVIGTLAQADRRVFCLIRSRFIGSPLTYDLHLNSGGWHDLEGGSWRWTAGRFGITATALRGAAIAAGRLELHFYLPPALPRGAAAVTLTCRVGGATIQTDSFSEPGPCVFKAKLPESLFENQQLDCEFEVDPPLRPTGADARELGIVVDGFDAQGTRFGPPSG